MKLQWNMSGKALKSNIACVNIYVVESMEEGKHFLMLVFQFKGRYS